MKLARSEAFIFFLLMTVGVASYGDNANPWSLVKTPASGTPDAVGAYSAGCLRGAVKIPIDGEGYQVVRLSRNRFWGHPHLITFLKTLGHEVKTKLSRSILIGDIGFPRGGPTLSGHASHQSGLDVDIWLWHPGHTLTNEEKETLSAPNVVLPEFEGLNKFWKPEYMELLKVVALSNETQRIFTNPVIKREICRNYASESWVQKIRPWWFHEEHIHVRLGCPNDSPDCEAQEAVPPGNGCDATLDEWFTAKSKAEEKQMREHPTPPVMPKLPKLCSAILQESDRK